MKKQAFNPYLPSYEYIPDGEPYVFDGRIYIYGSHDRWNGPDFCMNHYVTWSAPVGDLGDWRYEGVIFYRDQDPLNPGGRYPLFAPDLAKGPDGKYYLYYSPAGMGTIGVAVCDTPCGEFEFLGHVHHEDGVNVSMKDGDPMPFDPGVLVDDDGRVYLYIGLDPSKLPFFREGGPDAANGSRPRTIMGSYVMELSSDMTTIIDGPHPLDILNIAEGPAEEDHRFFEASSMRKINGKYTFVYSSLASHELCYALGDAPMGPFTYGGVLHSNGDIGLNGRLGKDRLGYSGNNHGSLVQLNGQWYIFGHRMTNYNSFSRQGVAEPVTIHPDGHIDQAEMTSCGLNNGPLEGKGTYDARIACNLMSKTGALHVADPAMAASRNDHPMFFQDGKDRECDPGQYIGNIKEGAMAGFKYFSFAGDTKISVTTRGSAGSVEIKTSLNGDALAKLSFEDSDTWHESAAETLSGLEGTQALYFIFHTEGKLDFMSFTLA